jgi:Cu/Ag efflux pump CusA
MFDNYFARQLVLRTIGRSPEKSSQGVNVAMGADGTAMGEIYQYNPRRENTGRC